MDDKLAKHDELLADVLSSQEEVRNTQTGIQGTLELILERLTALERAPAGLNNGGGLLPLPVVDNRQNRPQNTVIPPPKWELPSFEGHEPKVWLRKCERYFKLYKTQEDQKVEVVALYLNGLAEIWYHSLLLSQGVLTWAEFKEELISRFGVVLAKDVVEEFNKLSQEGTVDEFLGKFEDLKAQMLVCNPQLDESHFLSSFIGTLKEEIKFGVKLFKPTTLRFAIEQARLQQKAIETAQKKEKANAKSLPRANLTANTRNLLVSKTTAFRLSPEVYEHRKNNHLCYRCGEKYNLGHQCKVKQLSCLKGRVETETQLEEREITQVSIPFELIIEDGVKQEIQEAIYMNALSGNNQGKNTILVGGTVKKRHVTVMIDSGSTQSFIDEHTVKETGYQASFCPPVRVTVSDGNYAMCTTHCKGFTWKMHGGSFQEDLLIIPLGGCDLVLSNNWMKKHSPTKFDHEKKCVIIRRKSNKLVLQGLPEEGRFKYDE
ncbi:uncharacterized protein [Nicotiana sylvestris]|uniref:uncharacterized protein n=1 Tax=Nicotiana sylvestris TaxID=4096 RepID=UPI00388C4F0E